MAFINFLSWSNILEPETVRIGPYRIFPRSTGTIDQPRITGFRVKCRATTLDVDTPDIIPVRASIINMRGKILASSWIDQILIQISKWIKRDISCIGHTTWNRRYFQHCTCDYNQITVTSWHKVHGRTSSCKITLDGWLNRFCFFLRINYSRTCERTCFNNNITWTLDSDFTGLG